MSEQIIETGDYVESLSEEANWRGFVTGTDGFTFTVRVDEPRGSSARRRGDEVHACRPEWLKLLFKYEGGPV